MGAFLSGFLLGRLLFTPFMLRVLALAALSGLAAQARYGVHERIMYWLTYHQIQHDHSALVRFVDLNEPWMSWTAGVLYAPLALFILAMFLRLIAMLPTLLDMALTATWESVTWLVNTLWSACVALVLIPYRAIDRILYPPTRVLVYKPHHEILDPLPAGGVRPRSVNVVQP